ncbi:MAG TPA: hypothetical protein VL358_14895 [Caulobacteraceae bacterium]|jgi:hypothetical protein|nr:hypothetical protein [Caulobacteraceae bacterium]
MKTTTPYHRRYDPREIIDLLAKIDLHPASEGECETAWTMAADLISPHVASPITFQRMQARTDASLFVQRHEGRITGITGVLPLNPEGRRAIEQNLFAARNPPDEFICAPGDSLAAMYPWGFAATTAKAKAAVVLMTLKLRLHFPDIPFFTRAVTASGAKVVRGRMGYVPFPGAPDDLLWNPVRTSQERAA